MPEFFPESLQGPKCMKNDSKGGLGRFRWPLGRRFVFMRALGGSLEVPAISFSHVGHHFDDLGCRFRAHWILKRVPQVIFFKYNQRKMKKVRSQKGFKEEVFA